MAYVSVKTRQLQLLHSILTVLKEQDGEPMQMAALSAKVGFNIIQTAELMDLWKANEKIGFDMGSKTIWYKHDFVIRGKNDILRHLMATVRTGTTEVKELKETFPAAVDAIEELERAGLVLVVRGKDGQPPEAPPRYPSSTEFQSYWHNITMPEESDLLKELSS
ncbi:hypothetical protein HK405_001693, partial [Cladochytrium tenue]